MFSFKDIGEACNVGTEHERGVMGTEFSIPTTGAHADFIAELLSTLTLPHVNLIQL